MIRFSCPACRSQVEFEMRYAGCAMSCEECRESLIVPMSQMQTTSAVPHAPTSIAKQAEGLGLFGIITLFCTFGTAIVVSLVVADYFAIGTGLSIIEVLFYYVSLTAVGIWASYSAVQMSEGRPGLVMICLSIMLSPLVLGFVALSATVFIAAGFQLFGF